MTAFHRGAAVRPQLTFQGAQVVWDNPMADWAVKPPEPSWKVQNRTREQRHAACWDALEQFGKSSYRNRRRKAGQPSRYGVSR